MADLIKRLTDDDSVTKEQAEELIKCRDDINYFCKNYVWVQNPDLGTILFNPRDYQDDILNTYNDHRFSIVVAPRQCGKTQVTVTYLLHQTLFFPDVNIGVAAQKGDQAKEILARYKFSYEELPQWMKVPVKSYNVFSVEFNNGSSIEAAGTTGNTFRGKSKNIIYLDEFSHIKPNILEEFWASLLPVITGGGSQGKTKIIISSTPNGTEGLFAQLFHEAELDQNGFKSYFVDWTKVPGRDEQFKKEMMQKMTIDKYLQEFECAFVSSKGTLINSRCLNNIVPTKPIDHFGSLDIFKKIEGRKLGCAVDVGTGIGKDYTVIQIFDIVTLEHVGEFKDNYMSTSEFSIEFIRILEYLKVKQKAKEIFYTVEANSIGMGVINLLQNNNSAILNKVDMIHEPKTKGSRGREGFLTTSKSKMKGCMRLKDLVESKKMEINSKSLISELKFFIKSGQTFKAENGMHDDLVMACVIFCNMLEELSYREDTIFDNIMTIETNLDEDDSDGMPLGFF